MSVPESAAFEIQQPCLGITPTTLQKWTGIKTQAREHIKQSMIRTLEKLGPIWWQLSSFDWEVS